MTTLCFNSIERDQWSSFGCSPEEQRVKDVRAQILIGADRAILFPDWIKNPDGTFMQSRTCRLIRSVITNRVITFGACDNHSDHGQGMDIENGGASIHNTQVDSSIQAVSALTSVMETMAITDVEDVSMISDEE